MKDKANLSSTIAKEAGYLLDAQCILLQALDERLTALDERLTVLRSCCTCSTRHEHCPEHTILQQLLQRETALSTLMPM
jgi:hypothetical protein